jgi:hypothetical protein
MIFIHFFSQILMMDKNSNTVLILGDSTSMSIGLERKTYPFRLAEANIWPSGTRIINCSLPGFTATDATAFFFRHYRPLLGSLSSVIIYLGNCDAASSEVRKGKYGYFRQVGSWFRELTGRKPVKVRLKNRLLHYEWNNTWDPTIEFSENPNDFEYNIGRIIEKCCNKAVPVILVRPKANLYFPPGVGKGNFAFYRHINMKERLSSLLHISDARFTDALQLHESGSFKKAAQSYKEILLLPSEKSMSQEYNLVVLNNYAAARAEAGEVDEAIYLFQLLLKERGARKEVVLYNLAQIQKNCGDKEKFTNLLADSYGSDSSLYRIRAPYLQAIDRLSERFPSMQVVDMNTTVPDALYLDHCHPLPEGQIRMADEIINRLAKFGTKGRNTADIENILYNPELALGNVSEFHSYFKTFASLGESKIADAMIALRDNMKQIGEFDSSSPVFSSIPKEIRNAVDYYLRHPCFPSVHDVIHFPPRYPSDVGRFPEYYLVRHLIPYLRAHESNLLLAPRFEATPGLLRTSKELLTVLPEKVIPLVDTNLLQFEASYEEARLPQILVKVKRLLLKHLQAKNQVFERTKSTIFWYVRESLRFGAHSRHSMLYDRILLEFLAEGLAVAGVLDASMEMKKSTEIEYLIRMLQKTVQIHDEYCSQFSLSNDTDQLLISYNCKLVELAIQLEAAQADELCMS